MVGWLVVRLTFRGFIFPFPDIRVGVGLKPTTPQKQAGIRIDPATSLPTANGTAPILTNAASPPDDPPGVRERSHGFLVRLHIL